MGHEASDGLPEQGSGNKVSVNSEDIEELYVHELIKLTPRQLEEMARSPRIELSAENANSVSKATLALASSEWMSPVDAVHWLAPRLGGDTKAKSAIVERLRDGAISCVCMWSAWGPGKAQIPSRRPSVSSTPGQSEAFRVTPPAATPKLNLISPGYWSWSQAWQDDVQQWDWRTGTFFVTGRGQPAKGGSRGGRAPKDSSITRHTFSRVRFRRLDIEAIVGQGSQHLPVQEQAKQAAPGRQATKGKKPHALWQVWACEMVAYIHEAKHDDPDAKREPEKLYGQLISAQALYDKIDKRLKDRGLVSPHFEVVRGAIYLMKRRLAEIDE